MLPLSNLKGVHGAAGVLLLLTVFQLFPLLSLAISGDASALLEFMQALGKDPYGTVTKSWDVSRMDESGCPLGWYGVLCTNGTVHGLLLENLGLMGMIKAGSLGKLSGLRHLSLANNSFIGEMPDDLGTLYSLQHLDLGQNRLNGSIPKSFRGLFNVENISLAGNQLSGAIPEIFGNMSLLVDLDLSSNGFSGSIPATIAELQHLYSLKLSNNELIDRSNFKIDKLQSLEIIDFHQNQLSGEINPEWFGYNNIQVLDLSENLFSGRLPWQQGIPIFSNVVYLNLSSNRLSGTLAQEYSPTFFANNLQVLDLSGNNISGELPNFDFAQTLKVVRLNNNLLTGSIPSFLLSDQSSFLEELDLSRNNFSGSVDVISATRLKALNLSFNNLSGAIPSIIGNSCNTVDLSNNLLSGNLSELEKWESRLEVLDLSRNTLTGFLPTDTSKLVDLVYLNLSHNSLSGPVPLAFSTFAKLANLDLSTNQLVGMLPSFVFNLPALIELQLSNNLFTGRIDIEGSYISASSQSSAPEVSRSPAAYPLLLSILDLSFNSFNGSIPGAIGSLGDLRVLNLRKNMLSGVLPSDLSNLTNLQFLDISFNEFSGVIASKLPSSLLALNISYNEFSGLVPLNLACKFPHSAFFPGNPKLQVVAGSECYSNSQPSSKEPKGPAIVWHHHKKGISSRGKAGLIGGCTAAFLLLIVAILIIRHRRISNKFEEVPQSPEFYSIGRRISSYRGKGSHHYYAHGQRELPISSGGIQIEHSSASGSSIYFHNVSDPIVEAESEDADDTSCELVNPIRTKSFNLSPSKRNKEISACLPPAVDAAIADGNLCQEGLTGNVIIFYKSMILTAEELSKAPAEVLGRSDHGITYKATLSSGRMLAVKWLKNEVTNSKKEFISEARKLGSFKHPNVMQVMGCYWGPAEHEKLLLSDFVSLGSLAAHLNRAAESPSLTWSQRMRIAVDIASGLTYLHVEQKLSHGNLKASNVLLHGSELDGQLSDYGLHHLLTHAGISNQLLNAGALGYLAPELVGAKKPKLTFGADVYAFGVILMELLTGKCAGDIILGASSVLELPDWVSLLATEGRSLECFDVSLVGQERDQELPTGIHQVLSIALRCISPSATRPDMKTVYEELVAIIPS